MLSLGVLLHVIGILQPTVSQSLWNRFEVPFSVPYTFNKVNWRLLQLRVNILGYTYTQNEDKLYHYVS